MKDEGVEGTCVMPVMEKVKGFLFATKKEKGDKWKIKYRKALQGK